MLGLDTKRRQRLRNRLGRSSNARTKTITLSDVLWRHASIVHRDRRSSSGGTNNGNEAGRVKRKGDGRKRDEQSDECSKQLIATGPALAAAPC